jgi:hypothetical protein
MSVIDHWEAIAHSKRLPPPLHASRSRAYKRSDECVRAGSRYLLVGEAGAEHGMSALGLFPRGLVLNNVPVFSQQTVLNANDVYRNPVDW